MYLSAFMQEDQNKPFYEITIILFFQNRKRFVGAATIPCKNICQLFFHMIGSNMIGTTFKDCSRQIVKISKHFSYPAYLDEIY